MKAQNSRCCETSLLDHPADGFGKFWGSLALLEVGKYIIPSWLHQLPWRHGWLGFPAYSTAIAALPSRVIGS